MPATAWRTVARGGSPAGRRAVRAPRGAGPWCVAWRGAWWRDARSARRWGSAATTTGISRRWPTTKPAVRAEVVAADQLGGPGVVADREAGGGLAGAHRVVHDPAPGGQVVRGRGSGGGAEDQGGADEAGGEQAGEGRCGWRSSGSTPFVVLRSARVPSGPVRTPRDEGPTVAAPAGDSSDRCRLRGSSRPSADARACRAGFGRDGQVEEWIVMTEPDPPTSTSARWSLTGSTGPRPRASSGVTVGQVRTMIREHELAAAVPSPGAGQQVPADFIQDGLVVKGLPGLLTMLHDGEYDDRECIAWLFTDLDLPGPPDRRAAREPRLRGQAPRPGDGSLSRRGDDRTGARSLGLSSRWSPRRSSGGLRATPTGTTADPRPTAASSPRRPRPASRRRRGTDPDSGLPGSSEPTCRPRRATPSRSSTTAARSPTTRTAAPSATSRACCPTATRGYYREYTVETPGSDDRGARRIVAGDGGELLLDRRPLRRRSERIRAMSGLAGAPGRPRAEPRRLPLARGLRRRRRPAHRRARRLAVRPPRRLAATRARPSSSRRSARPSASPTTTASNFDALADCLQRRRRGDGDGTVLLWDGWGPFARARRAGVLRRPERARRPGRTPSAAGRSPCCCAATARTLGRRRARSTDSD